MDETPSCPLCKDTLLTPDGCPQCAGRLVVDATLPETARAALAAARSKQDPDRTLDCPVCGEPMAVVETRDVLVDRCTTCAVTWFDADDAEPGVLSGADRALLVLSMPERTARGVAGAVGGAVHEAAKLLLPSSIRGTRFYRSAVEKSLQFLVEDLGGVEDRFEGAAQEVALAQAAVGGFLDTTGQVVLHASPIWVLAAFSDVTRGTKTYLQELNDELVRQKVLPEGTVVAGVGELLDTLENVSGTLADNVDAPPLSVQALRQSYYQIESEITRLGPDQLFPEADRERTWQALREVAERENRSLFEVSTAIAIATRSVDKITTTAWASVTVGADLLYQGVFSHYLDTLTEVRERGYYATVSGAAAPYLDGAMGQLDSSRESFTERLLSGRLLRSWKRKRESDKSTDDSAEPPKD